MLKNLFGWVKRKDPKIGGAPKREYVPVIEKRLVRLEISENEIMRFLGIDNLNDLKDLKDRIICVSGHVRVVMHPLHTQSTYWNNSAGRINIHDEAYDNWWKVLDSVSTNKKNSPVFLFEIQKHFSRAVQALRRGHIPRTSVLPILTYDSFGIPVVPGSQIPPDKLIAEFYKNGDSELEADVRRYSFDFLSTVFEYLGIKSILASGMNISLNSNNELDQCLGTFVEEMRLRNFKIDISPRSVNAGQTPKETLSSLRDSGVPIKETGKS